MNSIRLPAPQRFAGPIRVPGDKSISHRAVLLAAIARGETDVRRFNRGADVVATLEALRALGVDAVVDNESVHITGTDQLHDPASTLDCRNSGTTMRLLAGVLAGRNNAVLDGDESLRRRPMLRVVEPLRAMGAHVTCATGGVPPVTLARGGSLHGIKHELPIASAQLKSALLLAGLRASGLTTVISPSQSRDHTEVMLRAMGADLSVAGLCAAVRRSALRALGTYDVPGDLSAAAYFVAAATGLAGSRISVLGTGINPTRTAVLDVLKEMGAHVGIRTLREQHGEMSADLEVSSAAPLRNITIDPTRVANLIDDIPLLCALASCADGTFVVRDAHELRVKESDRIASTVGLLRAFGVAVAEHADGISVRGGRPLRPPERVTTGGDHRIGMAAAVLAALARAPIVIDDADCIATSYPDFASCWQAAFARSL